MIRCYDQRTFGAAPAHQTPEIAVADLTGAALVLACWGSPGGRGLALPDAPPRAAMDEAVEVLRELGAVGADGHATDLGKTLARIPTDPRLARALLDGAPAVGHRTAAEAVAVVAGGPARTGRRPPRTAGRAAVRRRSRVPALGGRRPADGVDRPPGPVPAAKRPRRRRLRRRDPRAVAEAIGFVVALAFPDRVARRVPGPGGTIPADLRNPGRAAGRQPPVRARMAGQWPKFRAPKGATRRAPVPSSGRRRR